MLGGFFAGGGISYFGDIVSITPEDVYCYTIGTPMSIKNGASKNEELSVEGNRDDEQYADDTHGEAYTYTGGGTFVEGSEEYQGIKNLISLGDPFALLPPSGWGFTRYGAPINPNEALSSEEDMLEELEKISPYMYNAYAENNEVKPFMLKTVDVKTLSTHETGDRMLPAEFVQERLDCVTKMIKTNQDFVEDHYQDAMKSLLGIYGMTAVFTSQGLSTDGIDTSSLTEAGVFTLLDYAAKTMVEEGLADDEEEGTLLALKEILEYVLEEEIDIDTITIDEFVAMFAEFITENEAIGQAVVSTMENNIPDDYRTLAGSMFGIFHPEYGINEDLTMGETIKEFIKACYFGPDPNSQAAQNFVDAASTRALLYTVIYMVTYSSFPEITTVLFDENGNISGQGLLKNFFSVMLEYMLTEKDDEGQVIHEYTVAEMADAKLLLLLDNLIPAVLDECEELYGPEYCAMLQKQVDRLEANISKAREFLAAFFFGTENGFDAPQIAQTISTLVSNISILPLEHLDEIYLAKSRNSSKYERHAYYTVTFEPKNGKMDEEQENPISLLEGETIQEPTEPTRLGYRFKGWYTDEKYKNAFDFSTPITEDIILYAKWEKRSSSKSVKTSDDKIASGDTATNKTEVNTQEDFLDEIDLSTVDEWAKEEMIKAFEEELIPETVTKKNFSHRIDRTDFAAVAVKLYEAASSKKAELPQENPFIDTNDSYVLKAYALGITNGTSETTFSPSSEVTREQMATMLARALEKAGVEITKTNEIEKFADDNEMHDWGRDAIYSMASRGIIKGVGDNRFNPLGNAKIEEAIAICLRCIEND